MLKFYLLISILLILSLFSIILGSQNGHLIEFNYLIAVTEMRVASLIGLSMVFGALLASLFWISYALRLKVIMRENSKKIHQSIHKTD